jgi:hypothetical protein
VHDEAGDVGCLEQQVGADRHLLAGEVAVAGASAPAAYQRAS